MLGLKMFIIFMAGSSSYGGQPNTPIPKIWAFIVGDGDMMGDSLGQLPPVISGGGGDVKSLDGI